MKVLVVSPGLLPVPAVSGGAVETLMESLCKINESRKKLELSVLSVWSAPAAKAAEQYTETSYRWVCVPQAAKALDDLIDRLLGNTAKAASKHYLQKLFYLRQVKRCLDRECYDAVVLQNSGYLLKAFRDKRLLEKYGRKIIYHLHNDIPTSADENVRNHCSFVLISGYLKKGVTELCGEAAVERCKVVKNGIHADRFAQKLSEQEKKQLRQQLGIDEDKKVIVFVGRLVPEKGVAELLNAIKKLNAPDIVLMVVGAATFGSTVPTAFEQMLRETCNQIKDKVVFTGFVQNTSLWKYYALADVAVLPSTGNEAAGLTILEAAAAGVPVITTDSGGIPEYLDRDKVIQLRNDAKLEDQIVSALRNVFENHHNSLEQARQTQQYVKDVFSEEAFYERFVEAIKE